MLKEEVISPHKCFNNKNMKKLLLIITSFFLFLGVGAQTSVWDGSASAWSKGDGTKDNPYLIESAAHLAYLSQQTAMKQAYEGLYFRLETDIDLNNIEWTPIGGRNMLGEEAYSNYFSGFFDGNNKTVSNLKIDTPDKDYTGLFGAVESYSVIPEVKDLSVISGIVKGSHAAGVICYLGGRIINCSNAATVEAVNSGAGIVADGSFDCEIIGCVNSGNISGYSVGGIVETAYDCLIHNCRNSGNISGDYASGIVEAGDGKIMNCRNDGDVTGGNIAGIVRYDLGDGVIILSCVNTGNLTGTSTTGGIASYIDSPVSIIRNCYNTGTISSTLRSGAIVGGAEECTVENCYNIGTVSGTSRSGAIVGSAENAVFTNCHYLNTCIAKNNDYGISQTSENMKTQLFVNTLNASQDVTPWKIDNSQNDSYPVLIVSPYVKTLAATNITDRLALLNGIVLKGEEEIVSQGFRFKKYGTSSYSTEIVNGNNISSSIICESASGYIFQAFATTASGTYYGDEQTFVTTETAGIEEVDQSKSAVYPNPSSTYIHIPYKYGKERSVLLYVYDNSGKQVDIKILNVSDTEMTIDVSSLKKGVYFYKLDTVSGKFVVN